MSFFVDIVSEDSFYENLTLGIGRLLETSPCVKNVQLERRGACDRAALSSWEQKHCCLLTEDLRNFYTSTDGFLLTWSLDISGEEFPIGRMEIKELSNLKRYAGGATSKEQQTECTNNDVPKTSSSSTTEPIFGGSRCKLFELADCMDCRVFLAYQLQPDQDEPSVWLHDCTTNRWYQLADSFSKYFRMMLVHLGLPLWQVCAAGLQLPSWIEQIYLLVGPHLLKPKQTTTPSTLSIESSLWQEGPTNAIDPNVFRSKDLQHTGVRQKSMAGNANTSSNPRKKSCSH